MTKARVQEQWSSRPAFLLATIGAAVGLGNLWRFPFIAGQSGGGAFVAVYLGFVLLIAIPIIIAELSIGRRGQLSPVSTMRKLAAAENRSPHWQLVGWLSILIPLLGLSYYSVVAGWSMSYIVKAALNGFHGFSSDDSQAAFNGLLASPVQLLIVHTGFIAAVVFVVRLGVRGGIEKLAKFMMPALFLLLLIMAANAILYADIESGLRFLFVPDFSKLTPEIIAMALGQAFFSVAIGVGVLMTYGSYMPKGFSLATSAATIAIADTLVAIIAGIAIFPVVFQYGLDPAGGPGLIFVTLPIAFGQMPGGHLLGLLFFILLFFAAFTTAIGMLEPIVAWFNDSGLKRSIMAFWSGAAAWFVGIFAALSFNLWQDYKPLAFIPLFQDKTIFDLMDFLIANLLLPINGLLIAVFAGWMMAKNSTYEELKLRAQWMYSYWRFAVRYIAPLAICLIFATSLN